MSVEVQLEKKKKTWKSEVSGKGGQGRSEGHAWRFCGPDRKPTSPSHPLPQQDCQMVHTSEREAREHSLTVCRRGE